VSTTRPKIRLIWENMRNNFSLDGMNVMLSGLDAGDLRRTHPWKGGARGEEAQSGVLCRSGLTAALGGPRRRTQVAEITVRVTRIAGQDTSTVVAGRDAAFFPGERSQGQSPTRQ
jgi:hypothetical protein